MSERGEKLLSDAQYMDPSTAEVARRWVGAWRGMSREEFDDLGRTLSPSQTAQGDGQRVAAVRQIVAGFDALDPRKQRAVNVHDLIDRLREAVA